MNIKKVEHVLRSLPKHIATTFLEWVMDVEAHGLEEVRKISGYHDEPLKGKLKGVRLVRLSRGYRAYYEVDKVEVKLLRVERIDKHGY